jgi:hypothetical protein
VDVAAIRRTKWPENSSLVARRATLQARPRLFGQLQKKRNSRKMR